MHCKFFLIEKYKKVQILIFFMFSIEASNKRFFFQEKSNKPLSLIYILQILIESFTRSAINLLQWELPVGYTVWQNWRQWLHINIKTTWSIDLQHNQGKGRFEKVIFLKHWVYVYDFMLAVKILVSMWWDWQIIKWKDCLHHTRWGEKEEYHVKNHSLCTINNNNETEMV